jgi:hypothetical protein
LLAFYTEEEEKGEREGGGGVEGDGGGGGLRDGWQRRRGMKYSHPDQRVAVPANGKRKISANAKGGRNPSPFRGGEKRRGIAYFLLFIFSQFSFFFSSFLPAGSDRRRRAAGGPTLAAPAVTAR